MEKIVTLEYVRTFETRSGSVRYVIRGSDGDEYTTFRERIGEAAKALQGRLVRIEYHEEQRGQYTNVYLDKVEPAPAESRADAVTPATATDSSPHTPGNAPQAGA